MLYPKEDRINNALMFACRTCSYSEPAQSSSCVFRNDLSNTVGETAGITQDVGSDPTVGEDGPFDTAESPMPMCTMCGQSIVCQVCDETAAEGMCFEVDDPEHVLPLDPESDQER